MKSLKLALVGALFTISGLANAGLIFQVGSYTYYDDNNGLEWVYVSPCAGQQPSCGSDVTLIDGFRFAIASEWLASFTDLAGLDTAFGISNFDPNVCASAFFGSGHSHCDSADVLQGYVWGAPVGISASAARAESAFAETFLVRDQNHVVSEPAIIAIFALGLFGLGLRKSKS